MTKFSIVLLIMRKHFQCLGFTVIKIKGVVQMLKVRLVRKRANNNTIEGLRLSSPTKQLLNYSSVPCSKGTVCYFVDIRIFTSWSEELGQQVRVCLANVRTSVSFSKLLFKSKSGCTSPRNSRLKTKESLGQSLSFRFRKRERPCFKVIKQSN